MTANPDMDLLRRYLEGTLEDREMEEIEIRIEDDPEWQLALEKASGLPRLTHEFLGVVRESSQASQPKAVLDLIDLLKSSPPSAREEELWIEVLAPPPEPNPGGAIGMLGGYEVLELVARGGMGLVFKARDPALERVVALKVLSPLLAENETARERFLREARAAARLEHEHVLPIHGVHEGEKEGGVPWFVMRFVEGGTLEDLLGEDGESIPFDQLVGIARQIASALQAAHAQGIVHRDLKPSNILLDRGSSPGSSEAAGTKGNGDGVPIVPNIYLTDFGLARATEDPSLTYPGLVAGTPQYMAPEQAAGHEVDQRADLFSLGALLFHGATGKPPFSGRTTRAIMEEVSTIDPQVPGKQKRQLPVWFVRLIRILLAKNPAHRFQSAAAVVHAIDKRRSPRPRLIRNRRPLIAVAVFVAVALSSWGLLQVDSVAHSVNRMLVNDGKPYLNTGRLGVYSSLSEAVEKSRPGDTIEVRSSQSIPVRRPVRLPAGHALTIRGAEGFAVRLDANSCPETMIKSEGELFLENLTIVRGRGATGAPLIDVVSGAVTLDRCSLLVEGQRMSSKRTRTMNVHCGSSFTARNTIIMTSWTVALAIDQKEDQEGETAVTLDNAILTGIPVIGMACRNGGPVQFDMHRAVFDGPNLFGNFPLSNFPAIEVNARRSIFNTNPTFWWIPRGRLADFERKLRWKGEQNLFAEGLEFVRTSRLSDKRGGPADVATIEAWRALSNIQSHGSRQLFLWGDREVEGNMPPDRFDLDVKHLRGASEAAMRAFPGVGIDFETIGPSSAQR